MSRVGPVAAALVSSLMLGTPAHAQTPAPPSGERLLVVPFDNVTRDGRIFWLGEGAAVLLADDLNALGADAIGREARQQAFDRLQVPPAASLTQATVIRIGQIVGATQVLVGTLRLEGDQLVVSVRSIALEAGRVLRDVTERGPLPELFNMFERLARALTPKAPSAAVQKLDHPVVGAFENYIKGLLADSSATAISYLNAALQLDPSFDRVRLALWEEYDTRGEHDRALAAVQAVPQGSPWAGRARFVAGLSQLNLRKYDEAFATFQALAGRTPSAPLLNNLGVVELGRKAAGPSTRAIEFFKRATETDATDADYFFNLGYASWLDRDMRNAVAWLREAVRRDPTDGDAHYVLGAALAASGSPTEANREKELARRLSSTYEEWDKRPGLEAVPKGLERVKRDVELPHAVHIEEVLAASGQRNQSDLVRFYLDRARRSFNEERDRDALADLNRALFLSPYQAEAHLLMGRIHLRGGRVREAIDAFKISLWSAETSEAHAALAGAYLEAKDTDAARSEAERALVIDPGSVAARRVLDQLR